MKKDFKEFRDFIKGKRVAVVGIGVSNTPLIRFLVKLGAKITGFDSKSGEELGSIVDEFGKLGVEFVLGNGYLNYLNGFDVVFKTPSMRIDCDALVKAKEEGAYITSEIEEFVKYTKGKVIAITGSDGKTTTTSIVAKLLKNEGYTTWVGGNIGTPLFSNVEEVSDSDMVVLELSSFQLMTMNLAVDVAVVTNVTPNHLDMHKDMQEYIDAKKNIFLYQNENGVLVINKEDSITDSFEREAVGEVRKFSSKEIFNTGASIIDGNVCVDGEIIDDISNTLLKGLHNVENFMAAFLATKDYISVSTMKETFNTFAGVEHRCEFVRELDGVSYYNDSIASSPTRTLAGLKAFNKKVILIAGGYDKKIPFDVLAIEGARYIKELVLIGDTKESIYKTFKENDCSKDIRIQIASTLEEAVDLARKVAGEQDVITLSPACASFDMFPNFMIRGEKFKQIVKSL